MKKVIILFVVALMIGGAWARPFHARPARIHHSHSHHHHSGGVAAGIIGGALVGGLIYDAIRPRTTIVETSPVVVAQPAPVVVQPAPVVVAQPAPVYETRQVWVEGAYQQQVQPNGTMVQVWIPGHYESRTVQVQ